MRRALLVTAAVLAAVIFFALATLPPSPVPVDTSGFDQDLARRTVRGAYHVHTTRSDGAWDKAAIAAAADRAGLKFVIFTDHGDGTAPPDPPAYVSGVLCIDGVEISTNGGHYVALGMRAAPYPLGGEPSAVVEDVARLGGFGIAAHPDSPKTSLAWTDWDAPLDGLEWLSADSEWRDETRAALVRTFFSYLYRPAPALATLLDRPVATLKRWDELTAHRPVVALAAHDAHGGIGRGYEEDGRRKPTMGHVPSYESSFRTFSDSVILDSPPSGDAAADTREVVDAIRHGRVFTVVDAIASPGLVDLRAGQGALSIRATLPRGARVVSVANGREAEVNDSGEGEIVVQAEPATSVMRVEVRTPDAPGTPPIPWLVTNPVYFSPPAAEPVGPLTPVSGVPLDGGVSWHVEKDPNSAARLESADRHTLRYTLAAGARTSQFVALAADMKGQLAGARSILFVVSAERPARLSVQLRFPQGGGERWGSSTYVDATSRDAAVPFDRMRPLDRQAGAIPDPAGAASLLFVVDLTNARPGDSNAFTIGSIRKAGS
jgi:hypothetical protein